MYLTEFPEQYQTLNALWIELLSPVPVSLYNSLAG